MEQFNFNVQRQLVKDLTLEVGYIGKLGHKLLIGYSPQSGALRTRRVDGQYRSAPHPAALWQQFGDLVAGQFEL